MTCSKDGASSQDDESIREIATGGALSMDSGHVLLFTVAATLGSPARDFNHRQIC